MMQPTGQALHITGKPQLEGEISVNTAKNSVLYLLLGSLLTREPLYLKDVPRLRDIVLMTEMLGHFGVEVRWEGRDLYLHAEEIHTCSAPYELVSKMRASFVALGALIARCGEARISMPGGCAFGPRPVDRHIKAFKALGIVIAEDTGDFYARRAAPLKGRVVFEAPTVGGTQNVILASALGSERVTIENAALEPEVSDLADMLNQMGARISGAGTSTITIDGVEMLSGTTYRAIPDRIEAGTLMLAVAATRGRAIFRDVKPAHLRAVIAKLAEAGVRMMEMDDDTLMLDATGPLEPVDIVAVEYPGIPTDLQAPFSAFLATVEGVSVVSDRVYPDRFTHVDDLNRLGGRLELVERALIVRGGAPLTGTQLHAADIRAGGALIIAALAADGRSSITGLEYIERGYENISERLRGLGANIFKEAQPELATGTFGD